MDSVLLASLVFFVLTSSVTPGPNNIMLMASGANFGLRRTLPHMMGVVTGFPIMVLLVGLGLGSVLQASPLIHEIIRYAGAAYILWMAWKIGTARAVKEGKANEQPMSYLQAVLFQWVNPKAWTMGISAIAAYTTPGGDFLMQLAIIIVVCTMISAPNSLLWIMGGKFMAHMLHDEKRLIIYNRTMGILLALSVIPILFY